MITKEFKLKILGFILILIFLVFVFNKIIPNDVNSAQRNIILVVFPFLFLAGISLLRGSFVYYRDFLNIKNSLNNLSPNAYSNGKYAYFFGKIYPQKNTEYIKTPISQSNAVMYEYEAFVIESSNTDVAKKSSIYSGYKLMPCYVNSQIGPIKINSLPLLNGFYHKTYNYDEYPQCYINFKNFLNANKFDFAGIKSIKDIREMYDYIKEYTIDQDKDGYIEKNMTTLDGKPIDDISALVLTEKFVSPGESVCIHGIFNTTQYSVENHSNFNHITLFRGEPDEIISVYKRRILSSFFIGLASLITTIVTVYFLVK